MAHTMHPALVALRSMNDDDILMCAHLEPELVARFLAAIAPAAHSPTPIPRTAATVSEAEVSAGVIAHYSEDTVRHASAEAMKRMCTRVRAILEAAAAMRVASPVEEGAQPVAWKMLNPDGSLHCFWHTDTLSPRSRKDGYRSVPLYAAPPPDTRRAENDEGEARRGAMAKAIEAIEKQVRSAEVDWRSASPEEKDVHLWALVAAREALRAIRALAAEPRR